MLTNPYPLPDHHFPCLTQTPLVIPVTKKSIETGIELTLQWVVGNDKTICDAATPYGVWEQASDKEDEGRAESERLMHYLMKNKIRDPFRHVLVGLLLKAPISVISKFVDIKKSHGSMAWLSSVLRPDELLFEIPLRMNLVDLFELKEKKYPDSEDLGAFLWIGNNITVWMAKIVPQAWEAFREHCLYARTFSRLEMKALNAFAKKNATTIEQIIGCRSNTGQTKPPGS